MTAFNGLDRNGRVTRLVDDWAELLPITEQEAMLLRDVRRVEDLRARFLPNWDATAEERLELAIRIAVHAIARPDSGWVLLSPQEASLVKDALMDNAANLPEIRYKSECVELALGPRFEHVR